MKATLLFLSMSPIPLTSAAACVKDLGTRDPGVTANDLPLDHELCGNGRLPSIMAFHVSPASSWEADEIGKHLSSQNTEIQIIKAMRHLQCSDFL